MAEGCLQAHSIHLELISSVFSLNTNRRGLQQTMEGYRTPWGSSVYSISVRRGKQWSRWDGRTLRPELSRGPWAELSCHSILAQAASLGQSMCLRFCEEEKGRLMHSTPTQLPCRPQESTGRWLAFTSFQCKDQRL